METVAIFREKASGLGENRPGLKRRLTLAGGRKFEVIPLTTGYCQWEAE
jgi:hypothetical protein